MVGKKQLRVPLDSVEWGEVTKASGRMQGYSWYLQLKRRVLMIEIAEDPSIEPADLPLVGFGCGGWLYESKESVSLESEADAIVYVEDNVQLVFALFREKKLNYLPAITCPCSDLSD